MTFGHRENKALINKIFEPFRVASTQEKASIFFNETTQPGKAGHSRIDALVKSQQAFRPPLWAYAHNGGGIYQGLFSAEFEIRKSAL